MADNTNPLFSVANDATSNASFVGFDPTAHRGQTFDPNNPAEGAKYVAMNWLQQNNADPNSSDWATKAAAGLNALGGQYANVFSVTTGPDGTQRLSYGDEAISTGGDSGGGPKGSFDWSSSAPAAPRQLNLPSFTSPFTQSALNVPTSPVAPLNTVAPVSQSVGGQLGQVNAQDPQAAIAALLTGTQR
jgi:hypothetical protein